MCGIVGYVGGGNAAAIIYEGLVQLEYRGYDSAGIAVSDGGRISVVKKKGRVEKLEGYLKDMRGSMGIGHTRWATHGVPSDKNAHPHSSGKITVVHNGIIENYAELKAELSAEGESFLSETDSEVVAHLIRKNYSGDLLSALQKSVAMLKGSYALMVMCEGVKEIAVAKYKSPVILGLGEGENFCASDEPALAGKCRKICVLEDNDFALISADAVRIFNGNLVEIKRAVLPNRAKSSELSLGDCPHYMLKELNESPATVKNTLSAFSDIEGELQKVLEGADRIIFIGCGTAYHAALVGKRYLEEFARLSVEVEYAGEFRYKNPVVTSRTAVIAVTQSGETADTVEAARLALSMGAKVVAVTNSPHSAITRLASLIVPVAAGPEICVAATKSYSGQLAALYLLASEFNSKLAAENRIKLEKMPELIREVIENADIEKLSEMCARGSGVYFLGRGVDYAVALEGSLKLKEVSYLPGGGYPAGELKHGPLALVDGKTVAVFIITDESLAVKSASAVYEVLARGGKIGVISGISWVQSEFEGVAQIVKLPPCSADLAPLLSAAALHRLAYRTAVLLGRNPDKPRNLAKSVTVE